MFLFLIWVNIILINSVFIWFFLSARCSSSRLLPPGSTYIARKTPARPRSPSPSTRLRRAARLRVTWSWTSCRKRPTRPRCESPVTWEKNSRSRWVSVSVSGLTAAAASETPDRQTWQQLRIGKRGQLSLSLLTRYRLNSSFFLCIRAASVVCLWEVGVADVSGLEDVEMNNFCCIAAMPTNTQSVKSRTFLGELVSSMLLTLGFSYKLLFLFLEYGQGDTPLYYCTLLPQICQNWIDTSCISIWVA